jgi:ribosomal protein S18 acetylase RimI-like enzyme
MTVMPHAAQRSEGKTKSPERLPGLTDLWIRTLRQGDAQRLLRFYRSLSERSRHFFQPFSRTDQATMEQVVEAALEGRDLSLVALEPGDEVIAHLFFRDVSRRIPHLGIGVRDDYQGHGLGTALLAHLVALGRSALGKEAIGLTVMKENERAVRLYRQLGFEVVGECSFRSESDSHVMHLHFRNRQGR